MTEILKPGTYHAVIPVRTIHYAPDAPERWTERWRQWFESGKTDWSVWGEFEPIARKRGFERFNQVDQFPEFIAALELHISGYTIWHGPPLFPYGKRIVRALNDITAIERELAAAGLPIPSAFAHRIQPRPRNPDLVGFHPRHGWWCVEVKRQRERVAPEQRVALAVLRELLGAKVEVVRVVVEGAAANGHELPCTYNVSPD